MPHELNCMWLRPLVHRLQYNCTRLTSALGEDCCVSGQTILPSAPRECALDPGIPCDGQHIDLVAAQVDDRILTNFYRLSGGSPRAGTPRRRSACVPVYADDASGLNPHLGLLVGVKPSGHGSYWTRDFDIL